MLANPYYLNQPNCSWPLESSSVFLISGQGYFTFLYRYAKHNRGGGRKEEQTIRLGLAPSARGGILWHFLCILWANTSMYSSENSHKAISLNPSAIGAGLPLVLVVNADFCWLVSTLPDFHLPDWPVLLIGLFCSPLSTDLWDLPSLVLPVSWEILHAGPLCGFRVKTDKEILWLAPTPTGMDATHSVTVRFAQ